MARRSDDRNFRIKHMKHQRHGFVFKDVLTLDSNALATLQASQGRGRLPA